MADMNKVILVGRITRDSELTYTVGGYPILKFSIAVNRRRKQEDEYVDEASFFDARVWGKPAESLEPYTNKGQQVAIEGSLKQERWETQSGDKRSRILIDSSYVQLLGGKREEASAPRAGSPPRPGAPPRPQPPPRPGTFPSSPPPQPAQQNMAGFEDDIPF